MRVRFFASCLVELLRPDVGAAARRVLRRAGHDPRPVEGATCCGQPAYNAGYAPEARRVARRTLRALGDGDVPCVVASGSCATMMSHHWPELFEGTPEADTARRAAARTVELTGFLARCAPAGDSPAPEPESGDGPGATGAGPAGAHTARVGPTDETTAGAAAQASGAAAGRTTGEAEEPGTPSKPVIVHDSCHALRELGAGETVRRALAGAGHTAVSAEGAERCCGFGGSFSVKMPGVSVAMADEKLDNFAATGCAQVTSCDLSCLLHLEGRARRRGLDLRFDHIATLLDPAT